MKHGSSGDWAAVSQQPVEHRRSAARNKERTNQDWPFNIASQFSCEAMVQNRKQGSPIKDVRTRGGLPKAEEGV